METQYRKRTRVVLALTSYATRAGEETRTPGLLITSELLYRLSYSGGRRRQHNGSVSWCSRSRRPRGRQREQQVRQPHESFLVDQDRLPCCAAHVERGRRRPG